MSQYLLMISTLYSLQVKEQALDAMRWGIDACYWNSKKMACD